MAVAVGAGGAVGAAATGAAVAVALVMGAALVAVPTQPLWLWAVALGAGLRLTLTDLVTLVLKIYLFGLIVYWLIGFIAPAGSSPGSRLLSQLCEPVLRPVRRLIPPIGQIDFSPLWVCILISAALLLVR